GASRDALTRPDEAFALASAGGAWFTEGEGRFGTLAPGRAADFAVLDADPFAGGDDRLLELESVLTVAGGRVTWASGEYVALQPARGALLPAWSSVERMPPYPRPGARVRAGDR
ncbi:MAG: amidohydrolase family protein, partial [Proteobacteria bacterium]|nr:amidohydrolase family protein [Burkholderiales bacterium]